MALGDGESSSSPVRYWVGPPPPAVLTIITRLLELATFLLVAVWVIYYLGGVSFHPTQVNAQLAPLVTAWASIAASQLLLLNCHSCRPSGVMVWCYQLL